MDTNATLIAHVNSDVVTREQLANIEPKELPTAWFRPVKHLELVETIERSVKALGFGVTEEKLAIRRDGQMLFGVMKITHRSDKETVTSLGFRHANDRSMSIQMVAGLSVFVCDNMSFSGDSIVLRQKHSHSFTLTAQIAEAMSRWVKKVDELVEEVHMQHQISLTDIQAKALICDAFTQGLMPLRFMPDVVKEWREPRHESFVPRTMWSLQNAFTEVQKQMPMSTRFAAAQDLGRLLSERKSIY